jgi:hypothetical protein
MAPPMILPSVDLPAPFSPTRPWMAPAEIVIPIPASACTPA